MLEYLQSPSELAAQAQAQAQEAANIARQAMEASEVRMNQDLARLRELDRIRIEIPGQTSASDVYTALVAQRRELREQLRSFENKRSELARELQREQNQNGNAASIAGMEARLREMDARIKVLDQEVATANMSVARAAAIPGAIVPDPPFEPKGPPEEVVIMGGFVLIAAILPLSIAYARRLWKRAPQIVAPVPAEVQQKIDSLGQAVEAIGLEVERIGEGQRFMTRVLSEQRDRVMLGD